MRKVLANKLNNMFLEDLDNKIATIVEPEDFYEIFIVDRDYSDQRLLQISLNLTPKIAFWQESLSFKILPALEIKIADKKKGKLILSKSKDVIELEKETKEAEDQANVVYKFYNFD